MANELKATKGNWKAVKGFGPLDDPDTDSERWNVVAADADREYLIATIENGQPGDCLETEGHAAHLIASAPTLYAALESCADILDRFLDENVYAQQAGEQAMKALAKARGEVA